MTSTVTYLLTNQFESPFACVQTAMHISRVDPHPPPNHHMCKTQALKRQRKEDSHPSPADQQQDPQLSAEVHMEIEDGRVWALILARDSLQTENASTTGHSLRTCSLYGPPSTAAWYIAKIFS